MDRPHYPTLPLQLGLTGGIGSGKSTVGQMFQALGAALIDSDLIARQTTAAGGDAIPSIRQQFGPEFIAADGSLHRDAMRSLVFSQPDARTRLEAIVHPLVSLHSAQQAQQAIQRGCPLIVYDVPLLVESGRWARRLDAVVVVDCAPETQIERVMRRNGLARSVVEAIIASQAQRAQRQAVADAVINNDAETSLDELKHSVHRVAQWFGL